MEKNVTESPKAIAGEPTRSPMPVVAPVPERPDTQREETSPGAESGPTPLTSERAATGPIVAEPKIPVGDAPDAAMNGPDRESGPTEAPSAGPELEGAPTTTPGPDPATRPTVVPIPDSATA